MALTPWRKRLNIAFALLLAIFGCFALVPLLFAPVELWWFCRSLSPGANETKILAAVADAGYKISPLQEGIAYVYDYASLGRFICVVHFDKGGVTSAAFELRPD